MRWGWNLLTVCLFWMAWVSERGEEEAEPRRVTPTRQSRPTLRIILLLKRNKSIEVAYGAK